MTTQIPMFLSIFVHATLGDSQARNRRGERQPHHPTILRAGTVFKAAHKTIGQTFDLCRQNADMLTGSAIKPSAHGNRTTVGRVKNANLSIRPVPVRQQPLAMSTGLRLNSLHLVKRHLNEGLSTSSR